MPNDKLSWGLLIIIGIAVAFLVYTIIFVGPQLNKFCMGTVSGIHTESATEFSWLSFSDANSWGNVTTRREEVVYWYEYPKATLHYAHLEMVHSFNVERYGCDFTQETMKAFAEDLKSGNN